MCVCGQFFTHQVQRAQEPTLRDTATGEGARERGREGEAEEEGEWVECVDSFGRTRRCLKDDLPHMLAADDRARERYIHVCVCLL